MDFSEQAWKKDLEIVNDPLTPPDEIERLVEKWGERGDYFLSTLLQRYEDFRHK